MAVRAGILKEWGYTGNRPTLFFQNFTQYVHTLTKFPARAGSVAGLFFFWIMLLGGGS